MSNINFNTNNVSDPGNGGAIPVGNYNLCCMMTSAAPGETRTLADPTYVGQTAVLCHDTDGGAIAVTAASIVNQAANTVMTFSHVDDVVFLSAVTKAGALRWQVVGEDGIAFS